MSPLEILQVLCPFLNQVICFFVTDCRSSLHILDINLLLDVLRIFSSTIVRRCWILMKDFFCICWNDHAILPFILLMYGITFTDLGIVNHFCTSGMNSTLSYCPFLLVYCRIWFANILLRILASVFTGILAYSFLMMSLSDFGIRVMLAS